MTCSKRALGDTNGPNIGKPTRAGHSFYPGRETLLGYKLVSCVLEDPHYKVLASFIDTERTVATRGWRGDGELVFNGHKVSAREDEKALEMDAGDGYTAR